MEDGCRAWPCEECQDGLRQGFLVREMRFGCPYANEYCSVLQIYVGGWSSFVEKALSSSISNSSFMKMDREGYKHTEVPGKESQAKG